MRDLKALVESLAEAKAWGRPNWDGKPSRIVEASVELGKHKDGQGSVVLELDASHDKEGKRFNAILRIVTVEDHGTHKTVSYHLYDRTTAVRVGTKHVARYSAKTLEEFFDHQIQLLRETPELLGTLDLEVNQEAPEEEGNGYFDAGDLVDALKAEGLDAHVGQSGGGTATLYMKQDPAHDEFLIGPGSYHWEDSRKSLLTTDELYYGLDANEHADPDMFTVTPGTSIPDMAKQIADAYRTHNKMEA
jgi:hypothetical protein